MQALVEISAIDKVDLMLLDIDMPQISGIELSKEIRQKTDKLIFTTAHTKYGYEAFEVDADAYLLKPYSLAKFTACILKLFPGHALPEKEPIIDENDYFFVKNKEDNLKLVKIKYKDVVVAESKQNYVMIYTVAHRLLTYMSLTELAKILYKHQGFLQLHRSFIIGKEHIVSIDGNTIKMINGISVTVGEFYRKEFHDFLSGKLIKAGRKNG